MNPEAEKLRLLLGEADVHWPDAHTRLSAAFLSDKLDAALIAERRLVIAQLRERLGSIDYRGPRTITWDDATRILDELAAALGVPHERR